MTTTLASNLFDGGCPFASLTAMTNARQHDDGSYGQTFFYRGNVTQTTTPSGVTCTMYNTGGVVVMTTRNGVQVSADVNSSTNYAAPSALTTGGLTETLQWNGFLGLTQETGPNGDTTALQYDAYSRLTQTTRPQGAITTYTYITTPGTSTSTTNGHWTKKSLDGFGRVIKLEAGHDSTTVSQTDTEYDSCGCSPIGKMKRVSMAHAPAGTVYWTTYNYDGLGRTVSVVSPDGASTKTYAYSGSTVTVTDEAGKWKKYTMDAMGNVTQVEEPKPAADTVHVGNYFTTYAYDVLNHLKQVTMPRRGVTQTRTFNYGTPPGANLLSATNPENGTVTYTYNANNLVATKTDAKNQQTQYTYDANNRVTQIRHYGVAGGGEDTCQQVNLYYDSNPYVGGYSTYVSGRLAARTFQAANCNQTTNAFTEMFSYTPDGHVNKKLLRVWRTVSGQLLWADLNSSYTYDNEGKMTSLTYPQALDGSNNVVGGGMYTYGYDSMGRMSSMTGGVNAPASVTSATYGPAGELLSMAGTVNETRTYNNRLQLTRISAPYWYCAPYPACTFQGVDTTYTYSANQNNGRIVQQADNSSGEQVTYQYDELNRLISAVTADNPSVPQWGQAFMYDGFGNLTDKSVTKGSAPVWHGLVDPATNRASGYVYDANGNAGVSGLLYTYDIENRLTFQAAWAQSGESGYGYAYDPENRRVYKATSTYDPGVGGFTVAHEEITFWGATGQRMGTYSLLVSPGGNGYAPSATLRWMSERAYFGGRLIWRSDGTPQVVYSDRVGSIGKYFPYGEERSAANAANGEKFATYFRESTTGLDYAMNRYYDSGTGRFLTPDPSGRNAVDLENPTSWNMYAYVNNDAVNFNDPTGLDCSTTPFYFDGKYQGTVGGIIGSQSDVAILATAMYTESGHGPTLDVTDEEYAIGAVIMNRWEFVNNNWYLSSSPGGPSLNVSAWGTSGDSIVSIVENPSQFEIYRRNADGSVSLSAGAQRNLDSALSSNVTSSGCGDLAWALTLAFGMWGERNDGNPLYLLNGLILTGFNSFDPAHPSAPYEQKAGSFGDANTFYGVPDSHVNETPIRPRPVRPPRPPRRSRAFGEPQ